MSEATAAAEVGHPQNPPPEPPSVESASSESTPDGGGTLLTSAAQADASGGLDTPGPEPLPPERPEGYEIKFAEGINVDQELLNGFQKLALEMKLSRTQAQKLAEFHAAQTAQAAGQSEKSRLTQLRELKTGWEAEIKQSPAFKDDLGQASGPWPSSARRS